MRSTIPPKHEWSNLPKSAKEAEARGAPWFFTGKPCRYGHVEPRDVAKRECAECKRECARRHNDKLKPRRQVARAEREAERERTRPEREAAVRAYARARHRRLMREDGTELVRAANAAIAKVRYWSDPYRHREIKRRRYERGLHGTRVQVLRTPPWLSEADRDTMRQFYMDRPPGYSVDHIIPFVHPLVAGLHVPGNLQYLTRTKNIVKGSRLDVTREQAAELVRQGLAVWRKDVNGENGTIDWDKYRPPNAPDVYVPTVYRGEQNASAKLTEKEVREIRALKGSLSQSKLAARYGVAPETIRKIHRRISWAWLPDNDDPTTA